MRMFLLKLVVRSVAIDVASWLALIVTSAILAVTVTLDIGLVVVGARTSGEAQQAFVAFGCVALGFCVLVGLLSLMMVIRVCLGLQRRSVGLWQLAGVLPRTVFVVLLGEVLLVGLLSSLLGALVAGLAWFPFARLISSSGLPSNDVLAQPLIPLALWIGAGSTGVICVLGGLLPARRIARGDVLEAVRGDGQTSRSGFSLRKRILRAVLSVAIIAGTAALYIAIGHAQPLISKRAVGDFMTVYAGMGMLMCLAVACCATPLIRGLLALIGLGSDRLGTPWFLAVREASSHPDLTRGLIMPIGLAGGAVGVMMAWIDKLSSVLSGSGETVSAPPKQMAVLFGGAVIVGCVAASSVVFATMRSRGRDAAVLIAGGGTSGLVWMKVACETVIYLALSLVVAYAIVWINELAMDHAFTSGPLPSAPFTMPGWQAAGIVVFGMLFVVVMLAAITAGITHRQVIDVVLNER
ncbi:ABC transporter inner membrane protein [Bifidobacterium coryneforme]|uniref:ABC transporter inner membrane protein n=1 Tax=Bifidobacterium coryneforme TaxID=1687 RepID=A0ABD4AEP2_9BIFI|nr:FtsX-like permease family protein [Bifidobacterium coryneforme]KJY54270.1 ABC transporter inner membrane protein [Bifidobacterium coryneforme]